MLLKVLLAIAAIVLVFWVIGVVMKLLWLAVVIAVVVLAVSALVNWAKRSNSDSKRY